MVPLWAIGAQSYSDPLGGGTEHASVVLLPCPPRKRKLGYEFSNSQCQRLGGLLGMVPCTTTCAPGESPGRIVSEHRRHEPHGKDNAIDLQKEPQSLKAMELPYQP